MDSEIDSIYKFIDVALHCILNVQEIYSKNSFQYQKIYDVPVKICQHPNVISYIADSLEAMKKLLLNDQTQRIFMDITNQSEISLFRYVFELTQISDCPTSILSDESDDLEKLFRATIMKILVSSTPVLHIKGSSFKIWVESSEQGFTELSNDPNHQKFPWKHADENVSKIEDHKTNTEIVPIKSIDLKSYKFQMFMEKLI